MASVTRCLSATEMDGKNGCLIAKHQFLSDVTEKSSNDQLDQNGNMISILSTLKVDDERQAMPLEVGSNGVDSEDHTVLPMITTVKGDYKGHDQQTLVVNAERSLSASEIKQDEVVLAPFGLRIPSMSPSEDEPPFRIEEYFNCTKVDSSERQETEEQGHTPDTIALGLPVRVKRIKESSNTLSTLLSSEDGLACVKVEKETVANDIFRKEVEGFENLHKLVTSAESNSSLHHVSQDESHVFPGKWYEDAENYEFTTSTFSGPVSYSGSIAYSYSGRIPYSGSISHRSDSSTSTRSFAFPVLASDWNGSPVKMAQPDPRFSRQRRRWHFFCFCCNGS